MLRFLGRHYRVHLGTFVDDAADREHVPALRNLCAEAACFDLNPWTARLRSLTGLLTGEALTLPHYRDRRLAHWIAHVVARERIEKAVLFSGAMAQYVLGMDRLRAFIHFLDVDSDKWRQYADTRPWPLSWIYRREARRLLGFERDAAEMAEAASFVTRAEFELFSTLAPESRDKLLVVGNGVDAEFFSPEHKLASPFGVGAEAIVFTGVMDYWPNVDAVSWFAREVLPMLKARRPHVKFYIVGMRPTAPVQALARDHESVVVTGRVNDVRPYLQHAAVVVAPLRLARGVQNKALEAMAGQAAGGIAGECAGAIGGPAASSSGRGHGGFAEDLALCGGLAAMRWAGRPAARAQGLPVGRQPRAHPGRAQHAAQDAPAARAGRIAQVGGRDLSAATMHPEPQIQSALSSADKGGPAWAAVFAVLACALIVPAWYRQTALSMVDTWTASRTFTHGFLVPPLFAFLVWREREGLARVEWRPWPPALVLLAVAGFVWLLGRLAMVAVVEQLAMGRHDPVPDRAGSGPGGVADAGLRAGVPVLRGALRRVPGAPADGRHRGLRARRGQAERRADLPRRQRVGPAQRALVGGRSLQRHPLPDRERDGRRHLRPLHPSFPAAAARLRRVLDPAPGRGQLAARVPDRHARALERQPAGRRRGPSHLRLAVLRRGDPDHVLGRLAVERPR
jgi:sugar transferase (PEP-CTERM/EpsH1 system associated)